MKGARLLAGLAGLAAVAAAGVVAAQDAPPPKTAVAQPPLPPYPVAPPASSSPAAPATSAEPAFSPASPLSPETPEAAPPPPKAAAPAPPTPPRPPPEPLKRPRFTAAVLQGVDKITAETMRFEVKVGEPVRFKGLIVTIRACETTAADENTNDAVAYADVLSQPQVLPGRAAAPPRAIFHGWMFASSASLHPLEHPVYDLWLIACKTATPGT